MASNYWIKLYTEILHDPKMARMNDHLWRRTIELFCIAGELHQDGILPSIDDMCWTFRTDPEQLEIDLIELQKIGIVQFVDKQWVVTKFAERQSPSDAAIKMRDYRNKLQLRNGNNNCNVTVKVPEKIREDTDTEKSNVSLPFENTKNYIEQLTGLPAIPQSIKAIDEIIDIGATTDDISAGYEWLKDTGKPFKYYGQLVGPTMTAMKKRLGVNGSINKIDPRNIPTEIY